MEFVVINGPNLGFLGQRQPEIYGAAGMDALPGMVERLLGDAAARIRVTQFQSNSEGALIDRLEEAWKVKSDGIVLNAGAYTHTSLALADCLAWIRIPCVEVHLSNVHARQSAMRHTSLIARHCIGAIAGFGIMSYALAVQALWQRLTQP
jgi:3-dehydroquinate dehydratase-2